MMINEYKNEVSSLRLSDEFKSELKKKMLEVYEEHSPEKKEKEITVSAFTGKYAKYAALAACLLLVVSTAGILAVKGLPMQKSAREASENEQNQPNTVAEDMPAPGAADGGNMYSDEDSVDEAVGYDTSAEDLADPAENDYEPMPDSEDGAPESSMQNDYTGEDINASDDLLLDEPTPDLLLGEQTQDSESLYSQYASEDYDGDYNGDDYVLAKRSVTDAGSASVYGTSEAMLANSSPVFVTPAGGGGAEPTDERIEAPAEDVEAPAQVEADSDELETYTADDDGESAVDTTIASYEYYDIRDGVIAKLDKIALIRFTVEDAYTGYVEVSVNTTSGLNMDVATQTLYSININREYLSNESENADRLLLNYGTADCQLVGRPVMQGEYIALVYENGDGVLEPVPQLVYSVHNVNGLDIAYHVYCEDGYEVDPGSTNMGILPEETEVVTNTLNNPERYTQKAAVRELTYYLRRNIMRMNPELLDVSVDKNDEEPPAEPVPAETVPVPTEPPQTDTEPAGEVYTNLRANYPTGLLVVTNNDPDADGLITVNGISVGSSIEDAIKAFYLTRYSFSPDAVLTLVASEEDGRWSVKVRFKDGIVSEINMQ